MTEVWSSPRTYTTGELVTAAMMNTEVRDNMEYLYARSESLITMKGAVRMHVADSLGGTDSHRLVFDGTTYSSWHLCNGDADIDGTGVDAPDLRDKFVMSAGDTYVQGNTGGATSQDVSHTHDGDDFAAAATAMSNHYHVWPTQQTSPSPGSIGETGAVAATAGVHFHNISGNTANPGANPTHTHADLGTGATASGGSATLATLPPYRAAYWFICVTA